MSIFEGVVGFFPQRGSTGFNLESLHCDLYVPTVGIGKSTQFSRGSYTQYEDSLFKGGMTIPEIATLTRMAHLISVDYDAVILVILWKDMVLSKKRSLRYISYFTLSTSYQLPVQ